MVAWLEHSALGVKVDRLIVAQSEFVHAPHLLDIEVAHTICRYLRLGAITDQRAQQALWDLVHTPCIRHEHYPFLQRIWELRHNLSAYDAVYVALAEFLRATLITCDRRLAAARGNKARIINVS